MQEIWYNPRMQAILVVEDDPGVSKYLKELLTDNDYSVTTVSDGVAALNSIQRLVPNLVLLDLSLPNMSGEAVCQEIREKYPKLPVIILTAKDATSDIVQGLNLGADDYITKPFVAEELLARIKVRLRPEEGEPVLTAEDLELNQESFEVKRGSRLITLTPKEFKLLQYLLVNKGRILTREMILNRVWAYSPDIETRVVDVYMGYLRKKIDNGHQAKLILSVRGFGYTIKN